MKLATIVLALAMALGAGACEPERATWETRDEAPSTFCEDFGERDLDCCIEFQGDGITPKECWCRAQDSDEAWSPDAAYGFCCIESQHPGVDYCN